MNVVSMLLATALSAGTNAPAAPAAAPVPAPVASAPVAASPGCCGTSGVAIGGGAVADCGCSSRPSLFDRLRGMFARKGGSGCCDPCTPAPAPAPVVVHHAPKPAPATCGCAPTAGACDPCSGQGKSSFLDRLRSGFRLGGKKGGSDCGCNSGCGQTGVIAPAPGGVIHSAPIAPAAPVHGAPAAAPLPGGPVYHGTPAQPARVIETPAVKPADIKPADTKPAEKLRDGKSLGSIPAKPEITPAGAKTETEVKNPFELDRRYEKRVDHAADYSKVTGQLYFVHADGGLWVLRYAPLSEEDANGGSVILSRDSRMANYREGDLVTVEGEIIAKRGSARLGAPLYQARTISLVDRPSN